MSGREGLAPDSFCAVIYDPGAELKSFCPPQTEPSNEADALFIIKAAQSEFWGGDGRNSPFLLVDLEPVPGVMAVGLKAAGNGRRWDGREAVAYLDQRWAGVLAVKAV